MSAQLCQICCKVRRLGDALGDPTAGQDSDTYADRLSALTEVCSQSQRKPTTHSPGVRFAGTFTSSSTTKLCTSGGVWSGKTEVTLPTFGGVPAYFSGQLFSGQPESAG